MFRILFGAALASCAFYAMSVHPEWVRRAIALGREELRVAARNCSAAAAHGSAALASQPDGASTEIDPARVAALADQMEDESTERLRRALGDDDYDRRAAAARILLTRNRIPPSAEGVDLVRRTYLRSRRSADAAHGFAYLGMLALQGIPEHSIIAPVQDYVERHPQDPACDQALWALGELGSEEMISYFFEIVANERRYGPAARERGFCCLTQCGRYAPSRRVEMVPGLIAVYERAREPQTRAWALQGLSLCAPGVRADSIEAWKAWWAAR